MQDRFDPMTVWTRNTFVWVQFWQAQQEVWLRWMGRMAETMPRPDARELAAEAESLCSEAAKARKPKPVAKAPARAKGPGVRTTEKPLDVTLN